MMISSNELIEVFNIISDENKKFIEITIIYNQLFKEKNKMFFNKYSKIVEKNSLLKFRLQDLTNKKKEINKYLIFK